MAEISNPELERVLEQLAPFDPKKRKPLTVMSRRELREHVENLEDKIVLKEMYAEAADAVIRGLRNSLRAAKILLQATQGIAKDALQRVEILELEVKQQREIIKNLREKLGEVDDD